MQTTVSLSEVLNNIKLANNGYVFASSLTPEYLRRTKQLVARGVIVEASVRNVFGGVESAFFTTYAYATLSSENLSKTVNLVDYEAKLLTYKDRTIPLRMLK